MIDSNYFLECLMFGFCHNFGFSETITYTREHDEVLEERVILRTLCFPLDEFFLDPFPYSQNSICGCLATDPKKCWKATQRERYSEKKMFYQVSYFYLFVIWNNYSQKLNKRVSKWLSGRHAVNDSRLKEFVWAGIGKK